MDHSRRAAANPPRWIWPALGVVALAAIAGWWTLTGTNDSQAGAPGSESTSRPDPVRDFVEFAAAPSDSTAEHVLLSPDDPAVTMSVRESLTRAAEAIGDAHPDGQSALSGLIDDIDPMRPLLEQEAMLRTFFRETSRALAPQGTADRAR